ncbi:MAG: response regulator [Oligoflexia bacterium]|nr:response regulator [Oligoflexia bacterium]
MPKILIVDDSETVRDQLKETLEKSGYQVIEGADGIKGHIALMQNTDTELILCDVNMPNMNGISMCEKIFKDSSIAKKPPVVMLTTEADPELKKKGKLCGVVAWITKPYIEEKLLLAVTKILSMNKK